MKKSILLLSLLLLVSSCNSNDSSQVSNSISTYPSISASNSESSREHVHNIKKVDSMVPGEVTEGNIEYYECTGCDKVFSDSNGLNEISIEDTIIKSKSLFIAKGYNQLDYCEYKPDNISETKVPLVLFLHGSGERGTDNKSQLKNAIKEVVNASSTSLFMQSVVIAPQCPTFPTQWVDTPWSNGNYKLEDVKESKILSKVVSLVEKYKNNDYIDSNRVYVVGLSMGGFGTWDLIARHKDLFTAAVPICGGGPVDAVETLKDFPIYTFHGTKDTTVPYEGTSEMAKLLKNAGNKDIQFISYEGDGHGIWNKAIKHQGNNTSPSLENWLFSKTNDINNKIKRIACVGDSLTYGHVWHDESYPTFLQKDLGDKYVVDNFGVNGSQITGFGGLGTNYQYNKLGAYTNSIKFSPDIIIIMLGTNDATKWDDAKVTYESGLRSLIKSYQDIFASSEIVIMTSPATKNGNGFSIPNDVIKNEVNPIQRKVANELDLTLLDLRNEFESYSGGYDTLLRSGDGVHFSVEGAKFVASFVEKSLNLIK